MTLSLLAVLSNFDTLLNEEYSRMIVTPIVIALGTTNMIDPSANLFFYARAYLMNDPFTLTHRATLYPKFL
jgi:hypothetical protein